jgi:hypothetical protein
MKRKAADKNIWKKKKRASVFRKFAENEREVQESEKA